jgi:multidrug transporter EmrE-like cation transporter
LNSVAVVVLRALVDAIAPGSAEVSLGFLLDALLHGLFWAGAGSFVAGIYFWVQALTLIPLSLAYPTAATSYVMIAFLSRYLFDEPLTINRVLGMVLIIGGVALLYRKPAGVRSDARTDTQAEGAAR